MEITPVSKAIARHLGIDLTAEGKAARNRRGIAIIVNGAPQSGKYHSNEPPCEKTNNLRCRKQRCKSASNRKVDQRLCFSYTDSTLTLLLKSEISSFKPVSVTALTGLCRTCSETTLLVFSRGGSNIVVSMKLF